jgi:hypothetical protein
VFLASDGIADNFDPVVRKQATARAIGEGSSRHPGVTALSPAKCHAMTLVDMAGVLKEACRKLQQGRCSSVSGSCKRRQVVQEHLQAAAGVGAAQQEQQQLQQQREATAYVQQQLQQLEQQAAGATFKQQQQQQQRVSGSGLPQLEAVDGRCLTAGAVVHALLSFVERSTAAQRQVLEQANADGCKGPDELANLLANLPGKMDHASAVAYKVG